ncbi:hypothetical protein EUGRSUZ_A01862 [Eucalyptus grandis]|uniref:Uncharacterized protein n=2 Tax=Eucalyptus grandis TaxID=71139 RepID=A0ACC3M450_EUCGR|nr:hypothetical protein EUGRSUZ_A01862 [Eucalyptus grandis]
MRAKESITFNLYFSASARESFTDAAIAHSPLNSQLVLLVLVHVLVLLLLPKNENISLLVRVVGMQILVPHLLLHEHLLTQLPEPLIGLRRPQLVPQQHQAVALHQRRHRPHQVPHRLFDVHHVGGDHDVEGRVQGFDLVAVVPVEDGGLQGLAEDGLVALEVVAEGRHDGGDVGEDDVGEAEEVEAHAGGAAAGAELDGALAAEVEEVGVGVVGRVGAGPAVEELDEDEGAGPDGGADVHGAVVLLDGEAGVAHRELDHRRVRELHPLSLYSLSLCDCVCLSG